MAEEIVILLLGTTGSGKTAFVRRATQGQWEIADTTTLECNEYPCVAHGKRFRLIDTPGFDDTPAANLGALRKIAEMLHILAEKKKGFAVSGVIYFHRITTTRLTGSARSNIDIFERICGGRFLHRAVIATTMWNTINPKFLPVHEKRHEDLQKQLHSLGARYFRFGTDPKTTADILEYFANMKPNGQIPLQLLEEVKRIGSSPSAVRKTAAGALIVKEMNRGRCTLL
ncbi:nucleolar GTP-binding protein 1 [Echria macrotheca]|uniref:Nucleolar GTP-binding protein 1 n=1 Tax=Echria macrotheca TaxID=438768 RepID=A0AAJ0F6R3_9PEZI|nr:nucleolar GTP-binding protein 1 [Echria macrotheca]